MNDAYAIPTLFSDSVPTVKSNPNDVCMFNNGSLVVLNSSSMTINLADGTNVSIGGGDLVVNGISVVHHVHGGITRGGANTDQPQ